MSKKIHVFVCEFTTSYPAFTFPPFNLQEKHLHCNKVIDEDEKYCDYHKKINCKHILIDKEINIEFVVRKFVKLKKSTCKNCDYQDLQLFDKIYVQDLSDYFNENQSLYDEIASKLNKI